MFSAVSEEETKQRVSWPFPQLEDELGVRGVRTFFISSQDPDLDIGLGQFGNGFWNPVLKFIFNSSRADQLETETKRVSCVVTITQRLNRSGSTSGSPTRRFFSISS